MIRRLVATTIFASAALTGAAVAQDAGPNAGEFAKARAAVKGLAENLQPTLVNALKTGGPVAAIQACQGIAPDVAAAQSTAHGLSVGRTALLVRNPANAPDALERKVLESFAAKLDAGANPAAVDFGEVVEEGGRKSFRYMKAIPMAAEPCMLCHGPELKPEIAAEITKRYPQDKAVGFTPGKLRGAFTVKLPAS
jgi:hypothetical protein